MTKVRIDFEVKDAALKASLDSSEQSAKKLNNALKQPPKFLGQTKGVGLALPVVFTSIADAAKFAVDGLKAFAGAMKATIDAASKQEEAVNSVVNSLRLSGEASNASLAEVQAFASGLQDLTGIGDEVSLKLFSVAQAYGANKDQAKLAVQAAAELSAATGKGLDEALAQAAKTLGGFAGELGEVNPRIKALTSEQLKNGDALKILIEQYGGSAASKLNTFGGSLTALQGRFGDFLEEIGNIIVQNPVIIATLNGLGDAFKILGQFVAQNADTIRGFINAGLRGIVQAIPGVLRVLSQVANVFVGLGKAIFGVGQTLGGNLKIFDILAFSFKGLVGIISTVIQAYLKFYETLLKGYQFIAEFGVRMGLLSKTTTEGLDEAIGAIQNLGTLLQSEYSVKIFDPVNEGADKTKGLLDQVADSVQSLGEKVDSLPDSKIIDIQADLNSALGKIEVKADPKTAGKQETAQEKTRSLLGVAVDVWKSLGDSLTAALNPANILQGAAGAKNVLVGGASAIGDAIAPGAGQVVGPIVSALAEGPDHVREMVNQFADALPVLIENIVAAIPVLIETLAARAPDIIVAMVRAVPQIIVALSDPKIWINAVIAFGKALIMIFTEEGARIGQAFTQGFKNFFTGMTKFFDSLPRKFSGGFKQAVNSIVAFWKSALKNGIIADIVRLFERIGSIFKGIADFLESLIPKSQNNKGKGVVGEALGKVGIKLATGGFVRGPGTGDSVPALLAPGELVIDRTTGPQLREFLNSQGNLEGMLMQLVSLMSTDRQPIEIRIDGRVLGEAILDLNRRNQRLA